MIGAWFGSPLDVLFFVALSAVGAYGSVIILTRIAGLRSFAKMSSFDFAMTIAVGTLISSTAASREPQLVRAVVVLVILYGSQAIIGFLRVRSARVKDVVDNRPLLLMARGQLLRDNMRQARITEGDVWAALRGGERASGGRRDGCGAGDDGRRERAARAGRRPAAGPSPVRGGARRRSACGRLSRPARGGRATPTQSAPAFRPGRFHVRVRSVEG